METSATLDATEPALDGPLEALVDGFFAFAEPHGLITRWGSGAAALFGLSPEEMSGRSLFDTILTDDDGGWAALLAGQATSARTRVETTVRRQGVPEFGCEVRLVPVRLADGLDFSLFASSLATSGDRDVRLDRVRRRHARVVELVSVGEDETTADDRLGGLVAIFRSLASGPVTPEEKIDHALERTSRAEEELDHLRQPLAALDAKVERALSTMEALVERVETLERRISEGGERMSRLRTDVDEALTVARDAARQAEEAKRAPGAARTGVQPDGWFPDEPDGPRRPAREGFDDAEVAMATLSLDGRYMELNARFAALVGYDEREFQGARWPSAVDGDHAHRQRDLLRALSSGDLEEVPVKTSYMHKEGLLVQLSGVMKAVRNPNGAPDHLLFTLERR